MSERQVAGDAQHVFRIVIGVIAAMLVVGLLLLITVVLVYRNSPGRHLPFTESTPSVTSPRPSAS